MELTLEDIKKELKEYLDDKRLIEEKENKIETFKTRAEKITTEISDMPKGSSPVQDRMAECAAEIVDLEREKYEYMLEIERKNRIIENTIFSLDQPYRNILYFKYVIGDNLTIVANKIKKEYKWTLTLHGKALNKYLKARRKTNDNN